MQFHFIGFELVWKFMVNLRWLMSRVVYYDLLKSGEIINSKCYRLQLMHEKKWQGNFATWQQEAICGYNNQNLPGCADVGGLIHSAVFSRSCSCRLMTFQRMGNEMWVSGSGLWKKLNNDSVEELLRDGAFQEQYFEWCVFYFFFNKKHFISNFWDHMKIITLCLLPKPSYQRLLLNSLCRTRDSALT